MLTDSSPGATFAVSNSTQSSCNSALGRTCSANTLIQSGDLSASDESVLSSWPSGEASVDVLEASRVRASVLANAGIGKLSSSSSKYRRQGPAASSLPVWSSAGPGAQPAATPEATQTAGRSHSHGHHGHSGNGGHGGFAFGWF
jgi:hypothetical protein